MLRILKFFALFLTLSFLIALLGSAALMIIGTPTATHLKVLEIENPNSLDVRFFDSMRSDDDFVFYEFRLNAAKPVVLKKLTISEESEGNKREFALSLSEEGSVIVGLLEDSMRQNKGILIEGNQSLLTSETFKHSYNAKEWFLIAELTDEYILNTVYDFEEGPIMVKYLFSDKEVHAFWFLFCFIPISASIILAVLFVLIFCFFHRIR